jgi:hypothetical protein
LGPKEQFRFFAQYKYDASNHVIEEIPFRQGPERDRQNCLPLRCRRTSDRLFHL